jgi:hypothetical protein
MSVDLAAKSIFRTGVWNFADFASDGDAYIISKNGLAPDPAG